MGNNNSSANKGQSPQSNPWNDSNAVSVNDFSFEQLEYLFALADDLRTRPVIHNSCKGMVMSCLFYEASTRTNCSFTAAMQRLGGSVMQINGTTSSVKKGETLSDTVRCLASYSNCIVIRHPDKGSARTAADSIAELRKDPSFQNPVPILNAGDGAGEHPTQALLDIYTLLREQKRTLSSTEPLVVTLCGDLKYGRTTHSLAKLLCLYKGKLVLNYVTPDALKMPDEVKAFVEAKGIEQHEFSSLDEALPASDALYMTRVQKERMPSEEEYNAVKDLFIITPDTLAEDKTKSTLTLLHPLPRVHEITVEVDNDPRAAYFRQMQNGMFVRMALIASVLNVKIH